MRFNVSILISLAILAAAPSFASEKLPPEGRCAGPVAGHAQVPFYFPDPRNPDLKFIDEEGVLVAHEGDVPITLDTFRRAHELGYILYHTHMTGKPRTEFQHEPQRGVFELAKTMEIISNRRAKILKAAVEDFGFRVTVNTAFDRVVENCATVKRYVKTRFNQNDPNDPNFPPPERRGEQSVNEGWVWALDEHGERIERKTTWLIEPVRNLFHESHVRGESHSFEVWDRDNNLIAGTFGTFTNGLYTGWSIFHTQEEGKPGMVAMIGALYHLHRLGVKTVDSEEVKAGNLAGNLGGKLVSRAAFMDLLDIERAQTITFSTPDAPLDISPLYQQPSMTPEELAAFRAPQTGTLAWLTKVARDIGKSDHPAPGRFALADFIGRMAISRVINRDTRMSLGTRLKNIVDWPTNDLELAVTDNEAANKFFRFLQTLSKIAKVSPPESYVNGEALFRGFGWAQPKPDHVPRRHKAKPQGE